MSTWPLAEMNRMSPSPSFAFASIPNEDFPDDIADFIFESQERMEQLMDQLPSTPASSDVASPQPSSIGSPSPKRTSTKRKILNAHQQGVLERHFLTENRLPSSATRSILANALGLSENTVRTWFTNRRAKQRRQDTHNARVSASVQAEQVPVPVTTDTSSDHYSSPPTDAHQYYSQNRTPCPPNCQCSSGYSMTEQRTVSPPHRYYNGAIVSEFSSTNY